MNHKVIREYCSCPICGVKLNIKNLKKHQEKVHEIQPKAIPLRLKFLTKEISNIKHYEYSEQAEDLIESISQTMLQFDSNSEYVEYIDQITKNFNLEVNKLPSKKTFIKESCEIIYITWSNIQFEGKHIRINYKDKLLRTILIEGSLKILNQIKSEYFQRLYKKDIYKLIIKDRKVREDLSSDLLKIKNLICHELEVKLLKQEVIINKSKLSKKGISKTEILQVINENIILNKFLKTPAKYLRTKDKVRAYEELNNGITEEAILFIFRREQFYFYLWENVNSKRAAYLFKVRADKHSKTLGRVVSLIISNIKNKREILFNQQNDINKTFKIDCEYYKPIIHDDIVRYKHILNQAIN